MAKTTQGNANRKKAASLKRHRLSYGVSLNFKMGGITPPEEKRKNLEYFRRPAYYQAKGEKA